MNVGRSIYGFPKNLPVAWPHIKIFVRIGSVLSNNFWLMSFKYSEEFDFQLLSWDSRVWSVWSWFDIMSLESSAWLDVLASDWHSAAAV